MQRCAVTETELVRFVAVRPPRYTTLPFAGHLPLSRPQSISLPSADTTHCMWHRRNSEALKADAFLRNRTDPLPSNTLWTGEFEGGAACPRILQALTAAWPLCHHTRFQASACRPSLFVGRDATAAPEKSFSPVNSIHASRFEPQPKRCRFELPSVGPKGRRHR